ncbi:twin-arginine translocation signal domain-containing protein [Bythopirellula polymerisocia]|uniref:Twin-arginine translocation signal domain-containing protein n=1 Tax=Bythopirellula polymerisocia TaxID=2528003 RepID=A0A5C6D326_9BACT|nr:twin-arginine translocation signal domain-containing protein [Bythopirellula polymerisocia]TWU30181.1 hypothetical protein Pla144_09670 [Bythopirellula polymerisocia]
MTELDRRHFLAASAGAATLATTMAPQVARAADAIPPPPQMPIGKTGIVMSRVG